jgi:hypothetical protein
VSILVAELEPLLPERDPPPARIDWEAVVGRLGTALPADYRDLCERWGRVRVDRWLTVEAPADDDEDAGDWTATTHTGQGTVAFLARELAQTRRPLPLRLEPLDDDRPRWIPLGLPDEVDLGAIDDDGGGRRVCLDLGDVLGEPRRAALDGFLDHLAQREPRLHGAIEARREAVAYARERLGDRGS